MSPPPDHLPADVIPAPIRAGLIDRIREPCRRICFMFGPARNNPPIRGQIRHGMCSRTRKRPDDSAPTRPCQPDVRISGGLNARNSLIELDRAHLIHRVPRTGPRGCRRHGAEIAQGNDGRNQLVDGFSGRWRQCRVGPREHRPSRFEANA